MQYFIKEKAWSLREEMVVRGRDKNVVFKVKGKFFHLGDNLTLTDAASQTELAHIKQKLPALTPHYRILRDGALWASVHQKFFRFFGERFQIKMENGDLYHIQGNIWNWDFTVTDNNRNLLAQINKRLSIFADSYVVDIAPNVSEPLMIALAIVIERIRHHQSEKAGAAI